ncbi:hypothetical protein ACEN8K_40960, partial [Variovorax sp. CT11-76]
MPEPTLSLAELLNRARQALAGPEGVLPALPPATPVTGSVVFLAIGEGGSRARVVKHHTGAASSSGKSSSLPKRRR